MNAVERHAYLTQLDREREQRMWADDARVSRVVVEHARRVADEDERAVLLGGDTWAEQGLSADDDGCDS